MEIHSKNLWRPLYTKICIESRNKEFQAVEALKPENKHLNRYRDVYPYDHSRVPLEHLDSTNYINASMVVAEVGQLSRKYILTQGPLQGTVGHFWWMVWEQQSKAVIMLNRVIEKGTVKCHQYWPERVGETLECRWCQEVGLKVENVSSEPGQHYNITTLRLTNTVTEESREVLHFHYTNWPDFGVPTCPDTFLEFLGAVRDSGSLSDPEGQAVVHCSAGIGRSGTFVLVDTCLLETEHSGAKAVNVKSRLLDMRTQRMGLIQTEDQLKFSYLSIIEGARQMGLVTNVPDLEQEVEEAESSSEDSEEDIPPPLPPPRTESLKKETEDSEEGEMVSKATLLDTELSTASEQFNGLPSKLETQLVNGLAAANGVTEEETVTSSGVSADQSPSKCILTNDKLEERKREMELRRRKKEEEKSTTENKILEIQEAIKRAEEWNNRKEYVRETVVPFCVGLLMFCAGGYYYFRS